jgi:thiamine pyrophosphate-dependent acetolactate synthase large subunit-like protein
MAAGSDRGAKARRAQAKTGRAVRSGDKAGASGIGTSAIGTSAALLRRPLVEAMLADRGDLLVVTGLGTTCYDVFSTGSHPLNFYNWAGMGGAAMVAMGMALAQPSRRVLCITGDGEMLMGLGSLATIACERVDNLAIAVMDNEHYVETGMQGTHTGRGVDLAGIAKGAGFPIAQCVRDRAGFDRALPLLRGAPGPVFIDIKVSPAQPPMTLPMRDGPYIRSRFRDALLGPAVAHPWSIPAPSPAPGRPRGKGR